MDNKKYLEILEKSFKAGKIDVISYKLAKDKCNAVFRENEKVFEIQIISRVLTYSEMKKATCETIIDGSEILDRYFVSESQEPSVYSIIDNLLIGEGYDFVEDKCYYVKRRGQLVAVICTLIVDATIEDFIESLDIQEA